MTAFPTIFYLDDEKKVIGPFTLEQISRKLTLGELSQETLAAISGDSNWKPLREVMAQFPALPQIPHFGTGRGYIPRASYEVSESKFSFASFGDRFWAHLIDLLILSFFTIATFVFLLAASVGMELLAKSGQSVNDLATVIVVRIVFYLGIFLVVLLSGWLYHAVLESGPQQGTYGKQMLSIKVVDLAGQRVSFAHATGRYFAKFFSNTIPFHISYFLMLFTEHKQTLHDMIANTLVIKK